MREKDNSQENKERNPYGEWKGRYLISRAICQIIEDDNDKHDKTGMLALDAIDKIKERIFPTQEENKNLSIMDLYYIPKELEQSLGDEDLYQILNGILCRPQYFGRHPRTGERIITNEGLRRLNYILNGAARHTMRQMEEAASKHSNRYLNIISGKKEESGVWEPESQEEDGEGINPNRFGILYFKHNFKQRLDISFSPKDKKYKIFFHIKSLEDYISFSRNLLSTIKYRKNTGEEIEKSFGITQKNGLFIKNIIAFSDMIKNDVYTGKRTHFPQVIREIFYPLLQITKTNTEQYTTETKNHEFEFSKKFEIEAYNKKLNGVFIFCTKPQPSILDKCRRDIDYSANEDLQDMLRGSIIMDKHEDLIYMMHYIIKYFIKNPEGNFNHTIFDEKTQKGESEVNGLNPTEGALRDLLIKDKGILNTNIANRQKDITNLPKGQKPKIRKSPTDFTNEELNWAATQFLIQASQKNDRKSSNAKEYVDTKLIIPTTIRSSILPIELKFLVRKSAEKNNKGLQNHEIMRLKQKIKLRSRDEKHVSANKIKYEINLLLKNEKLRNEIEEQIKESTKLGEDFETPEEVLYKELTKNLITIKSITTEDGVESIEFCDKEIRKILKENNYAYNIKDLDEKQNEMKENRRNTKKLKITPKVKKEKNRK